VSEDPLSRLPAHNSALRRLRHIAATDRSNCSDDADAEVSDNDEDEATEADRLKSTNEEDSLIRALRSLEQTINEHTLTLTKRLRREVTLKETPVQGAAVKTGQRGDKVSQSKFAKAASNAKYVGQIGTPSYVPYIPKCLHSKQNLIPFSRVCTAKPHDRQSHRLTDTHATESS